MELGRGKGRRGGKEGRLKFYEMGECGIGESLGEILWGVGKG